MTSGDLCSEWRVGACVSVVCWYVCKRGVCLCVCVSVVCVCVYRAPAFICVCLYASMCAFVCLCNGAVPANIASIAPLH
jgi:hypothetical protein